MMFTSSVIFIQKLWLSWANMFNGIPNGNPYVAFIVMFLIISVLIYLSLNIKWRFRSRKTIFKNKSQIEIIYKVMNL